jgi:hypothetical protein
MTESSIKRIFAKADMPLSRIDEVLAVLKMDFSELARQVAQATPQRSELTRAQERAVVANPKLLLAAICTLSQWTLEQKVATYNLSKRQAVACLDAGAWPDCTGARGLVQRKAATPGARRCTTAFG